MTGGIRTRQSKSRLTPDDMGKFPGFVSGDGYTLDQALASVGPGWADLVKAAYQACEDGGIKLSQVKEKFGGLRIYVVGGAPDYIYTLLDELESKSMKTCEACGDSGSPNISGWIKTLCKDCHDS